MCILSPDLPHASRAAKLPGPARQQSALDALAGVSISQIASAQHVSRKFVYQQLDRALQGLQQAFDPPASPKDLLFWLPVTRPWLRQLVLGLVLICHSSLRGVGELLADLFDHHLSIGTVHGILRQAVAKAESINKDMAQSNFPDRLSPGASSPCGIELEWVEPWKPILRTSRRR